MKLLHIFSIDKIHCVGVDDSRMIGLTLDFEIVRDQANRTARILQMGRLEG